MPLRPDHVSGGRLPSVALGGASGSAFAPSTHVGLGHFDRTDERAGIVLEQMCRRILNPGTGLEYRGASDRR